MQLTLNYPSEFLRRWFKIRNQDATKEKQTKCTILMNTMQLTLNHPSEFLRRWFKICNQDETKEKQTKCTILMNTKQINKTVTLSNN